MRIVRILRFLTFLSANFSFVNCRRLGGAVPKIFSDSLYITYVFLNDYRGSSLLINIVKR